MVEVDIRLRKLPALGDPTKSVPDLTKSSASVNGKGKRKRSKHKRKRK